MATGDQSFSSKGNSPKKFSISPLPPGEYELKLNTSSLTTGKKDEPGKMPNIRASFEIMGHAFESGKARTLTVWFLTDMTPSPKDGIRNPERGGQILDFSKAAGVDFDIGFVEVDNGSGGTVSCLNPQQMKQFLEGLDGTTVKAKVKIEKANGGYEASNKVMFFIPSENPVTFG